MVSGASRLFGWWSLVGHLADLMDVPGIHDRHRGKAKSSAFDPECRRAFAWPDRLKLALPPPDRANSGGPPVQWSP